MWARAPFLSLTGTGGAGAGPGSWDEEPSISLTGFVLVLGGP